MQDSNPSANAGINSIDDTVKSEQNQILNEIKNGPRILLAEDYKHSQIICTRLLKKYGFENVDVVEDGEKAVNKVKETINGETTNQLYALILMDTQMPNMDGFNATEKIREFAQYREVPILGLTAFAMKGDRERIIEAGGTDYISKPIDSREFIDKVKLYTNSTVDNGTPLPEKNTFPSLVLFKEIDKKEI